MQIDNSAYICDIDQGIRAPKVDESVIIHNRAISDQI